MNITVDENQTMLVLARVRVLQFRSLSAASKKKDIPSIQVVGIVSPWGFSQQWS